MNWTTRVLIAATLALSSDVAGYAQEAVEEVTPAQIDPKQIQSDRADSVGANAERGATKDVQADENGAVQNQPRENESSEEDAGEADKNGTVPREQLPVIPADGTYRYWNTNWSFEDVDIGNVLTRLRQVGIEVPIQADGDVSVNFSVAVPINALRTGRAYKFSGRLSSNQLQLEQLRLSNLTTQIQYENGQLRFADLSMRWIDGRVTAQTSPNTVPTSLAETVATGTLTGDAAFQLLPLENFTANLQARSLSIAPMFDLIGQLTDNSSDNRLAGSLTGSIAVRGPLTEFEDIANWTIKANLRGRDLTFADSPPLTIFTGLVNLEQARLSADSIRLGSPIDESIRLAASIDATLRDNLPFEFTLRGDDVPLPTLASLAALRADVPVVGKLDVDLFGAGQLAPEVGQPEWNIDGRLASPKLSVYGFQLGLIEHRIEFDNQHFELASLRERPLPAMLIQQIAAEYELSPQQIVLNQLEAIIFDGTISGDAVYAREDTGTHRDDLRWREISPLVNLRNFLPASAELSLETSVSVEWQLPASSIDQLSTHLGTATLVINPIKIDASNIGDLQAEIRVGEGELALNGSGKLFGGSFEVDTVAPLANKATDENSVIADRSTPNTDRFGPSGGTLFRLERLNVRAAQLLLAPGSQSVAGFVSGTINLAGYNPVRAEARLRGTDFRLGNAPLASRLETSLSISGQELNIRSLRGNYAGGRFEVAGRLGLENLRGRLSARLEAVDFARGTLPISPALSGLVGGKLSSRASINVGNKITIRGAVKVRDNEIFRIPTGATHGNLRIVFAKDFGSWSADFRNLKGTVGRGLIEGDLHLASSRTRPGTFNMDSQWRAKRLDFTSLLAGFGSQSQYARGQLDGSLLLSGEGIRSVADLRGRFDARLGGTQARAVPGLVATQSYLGAFSMAGTVFNSGRVRGNIGAGVIDLAELWLISDQVNVWADGRIRIPSGRLDIAVVVQTGDFEAQNLALLTLVEAAALPAGIPVGAIIQLNRLASDRTLYFDVVGKLPRPRIRLRPFDVLRENAAKFLLREAAASAIPFSSAATILPFDQND